MKTNAHKWKQKKKNQPDNGASSQQGAGWLFSSCHQCPPHSHAIKICQHFPTRPPAFTLMPCCVLPARRIHAERSRCQHFQRSRRVFTAALRWPQSQPRRHTRGVFTCTHVSNGSRYCRWFGGFLRHGIMCTLYSIGRLWVGGVDVGVACRRGGLSNTALSTTRRSRRRRRFPVIKSHACMARGLLVRQSLVIGVFSLIGHTTSIRAVVCLRLPVAIYVLFDAPCLQTLLWMYAVHIYSIYWYACGSITAC